MDEPKAPTAAAPLPWAAWAPGDDGWSPGRPSRDATRRVAADPERIERGMAQLVLTVIELLRELMERQALRRFESGSLTAAQEEELGTALLKLATTMGDLKEHFGLSDEDLNLSLGPLGNLL